MCQTVNSFFHSLAAPLESCSIALHSSTRLLVRMRPWPTSCSTSTASTVVSRSASSLCATTHSAGDGRACQCNAHSRGIPRVMSTPGSSAKRINGGHFMGTAGDKVGTTGDKKHPITHQKSRAGDKVGTAGDKVGTVQNRLQIHHLKMMEITRVRARVRLRRICSTISGQAIRARSARSRPARSGDRRSSTKNRSSLARSSPMSSDDQQTMSSGKTHATSLTHPRT